MDTSKTQDIRNDPLGGLALEPSNELRFKGPFDNDFSSVTLSISNPTEKRIAFKIKTTAPKRYCVKPNSGVLDPTKSMKVNVLLQPFQHDPNEKLKHKFMVQYMYLNEEENKMEVQDILNRWKDVPTGRLLDIKLKCLFESEANDTTSQNKSPQTPQQQQQQQQQQQTKSTTNSLSNAPNDLYTSIANNNDNNELRARSRDSEKPVAAVKTTSSSPNRNSARGVDNQPSYESTSSSPDEEVRLKKMVLPHEQPKPSSSSSTTSGTYNKPSTINHQQADLSQSLLMFLNNKSIWIIVLLLAIIVYLLVFKS